jgi:hypothetical protein
MVLQASRALIGLALYQVLVLGVPLAVPSQPSEGRSHRMWDQLVADAAKLHLPTIFLMQIPADFVQFEFEDLRTYAAEYHPAEHRMVLNRTLSFNSAGGTLKPLKTMTHKELEVLYHELFHAYMDFLSSQGDRSKASHPLLAFARRQQACRYGEVAITPVVQRKDETETRYLTESESWEALNETWAVFVGWTIWNQLELQQKSGGAQRSREGDQWALRFEQAVQKGELRGYYVPEDQDERRVAAKRFLAKQSQISGSEALMLLKEVLGFPQKMIDKLPARPALSGFFKKEPACQASAQG